MRVRVKEGEPGKPMGYMHHQLWYAGQELDIQDLKEFSPRWMEKVPDPPVQIVEVEVPVDKKPKR